jgi:hypothetical protein
LPLFAIGTFLNWHCGSGSKWRAIRLRPWVDQSTNMSCWWVRGNWMRQLAMEIWNDNFILKNGGCKMSNILALLTQSFCIPSDADDYAC